MGHKQSIEFDPSRKRALITGIAGQCGSYLAEHLLSLGYYVTGIVPFRSDPPASRKRIDHLGSHRRLILQYGDMTDGATISRIVRESDPHEIYNLAALSHVRVSFDLPEQSGDINGLGTLRLLEAIREHCPQARLYQASSSELFGNSPAPQSESTPFWPRSPYAVSKLFAYWSCRNYREAYGIFACNGILFNNESPRRGLTFVTRKITRGVAAIACGRASVISLGNMSALRDWGHSADYVKAMHLMLQQPEPDDYVIATGRACSVRDFCRMAFEQVGIGVQFHDEGTKGELAIAVSVDRSRQRTRFERLNTSVREGQVVVQSDLSYYRPSEVDHLCGDATKARERLGWEPTISLEELIKEMVAVDLASESRELL